MTGQPGSNDPAQRVFLVEDNAVVRRGIQLLVEFEPDLVVCGEAEDADEALAKIRDLRPDLAIVDLTLKDSSGLGLIPRLRAECPQVRILVLSMHDQPRWIELALLAGAGGYLTKDESPDQLVHAIRQLLTGQRFLSERGLIRLGEQASLGWLASGHIPDREDPPERPTPARSPSAPASDRTPLKAPPSARG